MKCVLAMLPLLLLPAMLTAHAATPPGVATVAEGVGEQRCPGVLPTAFIAPDITPPTYRAGARLLADPIVARVFDAIGLLPLTCPVKVANVPPGYVRVCGSARVRPVIARALIDLSVVRCNGLEVAARDACTAGEARGWVADGTLYLVTVTAVGSRTLVEVVWGPLAPP